MAPSAIVSDLMLPAQIPESKKTAANAPSQHLFSLQGQTIAITGGARGLGLTLAKAVVEAGASVACLDVLTEPSPAEWTELQKLAKQSRLTATYDRCDITNEEEVERVLQKVASQGQAANAPFSGIVACAGVQQMIPAVEYPIADFQSMVNKLRHIMKFGALISDQG
jgi:NAD(P)-dependent dehydrogenase (short-subunit alcohol dehydrogenase family)